MENDWCTLGNKLSLAVHSFDIWRASADVEKKR